ncbi:unnamed protein product [Effrenium voratum]|uniref:Uncharacterized protein n=1 Tax=Effrenium voratum TaxID=2562239 RepID=A0AA36IFY4_9DINO|nr:unnamed protein product [Effrenium voratum]
METMKGRMNRGLRVWPSSIPDNGQGACFHDLPSHQVTVDKRTMRTSKSWCCCFCLDSQLLCEVTRRLWCAGVVLRASPQHPITGEDCKMAFPAALQSCRQRRSSC